MLGVVNLDKPVGVTSHDMVGLMRRLTGMRRIGHAGTLDPLASGVLPVLVGGATRFSEELTGGRKRYAAVVRLGIRSLTDDGEGPLEPSGSLLPDRDAVEAALGLQEGTVEQRPPAFSARKVGGQTAHRAARAGTPLELTPRTVSVERIELLELVPGDGWLDVSLDIVCGPGTYIRSIARDLGDELGCGGYLHALRRLEAAGLHARDGFTPPVLEELAAAGDLGRAVIPVTDLLPFPRISLAVIEGFLHGSATRVDPGTPDGRHVAVAADGRLLGIGTVRAGLLQPEKVLVDPAGPR